MIRPRAFALAGAYLLRVAVDAARAAIYSTSVDCCQSLTVLSLEISDWIRVQYPKLPGRDQPLTNPMVTPPSRHPKSEKAKAN